MTDKTISQNAKEVVLATLGLYKAAYDTGVSKYTELNELRQSEFDALVKRGESVESLVTKKYDEFLKGDSFVAKRFQDVEAQYGKVVSFFGKEEEKPAKKPRAKAAAKKPRAKAAAKAA